jgi:DMSO/TMAO reductase YedYZ molybdopterin-dependent catalytic subunit
MNRSLDEFLLQHQDTTRRYFLKLGAVGAAVMATSPLFADELFADEKGGNDALAEALKKLEPWLTEDLDFRDVSRGTPKPHSLDEAKRKEVGLTRDTWKLEVVSDPSNKARIRNEFTKKDNTAFDFKALMELAKTKAVRFAKVMTCLNIGCPLGNGIWEGVPLRDIVWLTQPRDNLRRVFYHGYHNDDPGQKFQSSMPIGRILEDAYDLPPVIVCYKLNGDWLSPKRGAPVRIVVPEAYGFKSIKWLSKLTLSNLHSANDTYAGGNNDVDSELKSFAATLTIPTRQKAAEPFAVTGYAQVGFGGLSKVQYWLHDDSQPTPSGDKYFTSAPWKDAKILPVPATWGKALKDTSILKTTQQFDENGQPKTWPLRLSKAHWACVIDGLTPGKYTFRCRTIDEKGHGQPMPRPFRKSGHCAIEQVSIKVS